jgi:hypothetical protein
MRMIITTIDEFEVQAMKDLLKYFKLAGVFIKSITFENEEFDKKEGE